MAYNPNADILMQKAAKLDKAKTTKQVKFSSDELSLSLNQFRQQYPNADAATERVWLAQQAAAHPTNQNMSFLEDAATDIGIAFGDRLPQTGAALLGVAADAVGLDGVSEFAWDAVETQRQEQEESQKLYSPSLKESKAKLVAASAARKDEYLNDGKMTIAETVDDFVHTAGDYIANPRAAASEALQSSESLVTAVAGGGIAGTVAKGAAKSVITKRAGKEALERAASKKIIDKAGNTAAQRTGLAYTGVSEGASNAAQTREALQAIPDEVLIESEDFKEYLNQNDGDFDKAKDEFVKSGTADAFLQTAVVAAAIGKASGASDAASTALVNKSTKSAVRDVVESTGKEAVEETLQSGAGEAISNVQVKEGDKSQEVLENVGSSAASGAVAGGLTGGTITGGAKVAKSATTNVAKGAAKVAEKTAATIESRKEATAKEEATAINSGYENTTEVEALDKYTSLKGNDLIRSAKEATGAIMALRERTDLTPEQATARDEKIATIKKNLIEASGEAVKAQQAAVKKAETEPESLDETETQLATSAVVSDDGTVNTKLARRLSGSKHTTTNQKALFKALTNPESVVSKSLKTSEEVRQEIMGGGENFTGLSQYVDSIQTAVKTGDQEGALFALNRLQKFNKAQSDKAKSGRLNGSKMTPELHAMVKEESEAIGIVYKAVNDTVTKTFPEVGEIQKTSLKEKAVKQASRLRPERKRGHTVPQTQREALVRESVASILDSSNTDAQEAQFALNKAGITTSTVKSLKDAFETIDAAENIKADERTPETAQELRKAKELVSDTYVTLKDALGEEQLVEALKTHGDVENVDKIIDSLPTAGELNTEELTYIRGHVTEPLRNVKPNSTESFAKYDSMVQDITDFVEADPSVLEKGEGLQPVYNKLKGSKLNALAEDNLVRFNAAVEMINLLEVPNTDVTTADSSVKAVSTTPRNRVFQNVIEASPVGSVLRGFRSIPRNLGLFHTESDLVTKLSDPDSDIYLHLTRNLNHKDKMDLDKFIRFAGKFERKLNKTLKGRKHEKTSAKGKHIQVTHNDHLDAFLEDGLYTPEVALALSTAYANWATTNGSKSLFLKAAGIGKLLGVDNPDDFQPNAEERKLHEAGVSFSFAAEQIGRDVLRQMGLVAKGDTDENHTKQLATNLGMAAIGGGLADGEYSGMVRKYVHVVRNEYGKVVMVDITDTHTRPKQIAALAKELGTEAQTIATVKARPNRSQVEGEPTRLNSNMEDAIAGASNDTLTRDFLGIESAFEKVYYDEDTMPEHSVEQGISPKQVEALNKNQNIPYDLDTEMWDLMNQFDEDFRMSLVDNLPDEGNEHVNNVERNKDIREGILKQFADAATMIQEFAESGSKHVRFAMNPSKKNKRMSMAGTLGNPQNSKLIRHLFKMANNRLTIDPKDETMMLSYKMAVLEALDVDGSIARGDVKARGVDKSEDGEIAEAFNAYLQRKDVQEILEVMRKPTKTKEDAKRIQEFIGKGRVKKANATTGSAAKLDGLVALAKYTPDASFEVNIFKENDGITNGIAIGLLQLASAESFQGYVEKLARVGIYVDSDTLSFGTFAKEGHKDSYMTFGDNMTKIMQSPNEYPQSDENILPELDLKRNIGSFIFDKADRAAMQKSTIPVTDASGKTTQQPRLEKNKIRITLEEYHRMSGAMSLFLGKDFYDADGNFKTLAGKVQEVIRDFAKSPLMIANYGASMVGLKKSIAGSIVRSVELALEEINVLEGEARTAAISSLEQHVNAMSIIKDDVVEWGEKDGKAYIVSKTPYEFKVAENPLETPVGRHVYNMAAAGVELSYGAAMEKAFDIEYGQQRRDMDKVIQATRAATAVYSRLYNKARAAKLKEVERNYLTVDEVNQIKDDLRPYAPIIATALSEDRLNDGIWIPKGEKTKDRADDGSYVNEDTDKVQVSLNTGTETMTSNTFSDKVQDPSVSAAAVLVQSLDATTQVLSMIESELVNVHDASIFALDRSFEGTLLQNQRFFEAMQGYSLFDATVEMYKGVLAHPDVDDAMLAEVQEELGYGLKKHIPEEGNMSDFIENLDETSKRIQHNKNLLVKNSQVNVNQYSAGDKSSHQHQPETERSYEDREISWKDADATFGEAEAEVQESTDSGSELSVNPETQVSKINEDTVVEAYGTTKSGKRDKRISDEVLAVKEALLTRLNEGQYYTAAKREMLKSKDKATKSLFRGIDRKLKLANRGSTNSGRSARAEKVLNELEINKNTARIIFNSLEGVGAVKATKEESQYLSDILAVMEPSIQAMNLAIFGADGEARGEVVDSGIELVINTGAKASGIEMSAQEVLVHELMHTFLQGGDKKSRAYREIKKMYLQARKDLKVRDFLGGIENPTKQDLIDARARYNHTVNNSFEGGRKYVTYLGEEKNWMNADPAEEFAVMALTNPRLRKALEQKELRLNEEAGTMFGKLKALFAWLFDKFSKDLTLEGMSSDKRIIRLAEHMHGSLNQKRSLIYRMTSIQDTPLDAASAWIKDVIGSYSSQVNQAYAVLKDTETVKDVESRLAAYRDAALNSAIAKDSLVQGVYNEFTNGRRSLADLTRLISKSSHIIERKSQFLIETITKDLKGLMENITEEQSADVYRMLETDVQSLLGQYSNQEIIELMTDSHKRKVRMSKLIRDLQKAAPTASRYMATHAKDLGYHMVTGERLILDGKYINAYQIANMWGYTGRKGNIAVKRAEAIVDELATLNALEFADIDASMHTLFGSNLGAMETILNYQRQTKDAAMETTFKGNEFNYRKGYVKEEFDNRVDIVVAPKSDRVRLEKLGYTMGEAVTGDPLTRGLGQHFFVKENGEMTKYLTGALSTASPKSRGTDLFQVSNSDSELTRLRLGIEAEALAKGKEAESQRVFNGSNTLLKGEFRSHVAQPIFDSNGSVTGYRYIASHNTKDKIHGRKKDFARAIGTTFAGVSRRVETSNINRELVDYFHQTFTNDYHKNPDLFVDVANDPKYKDQYNLMPLEAKKYARELFGSKSLYVPRTQVDIAFGYRKFSVSQLQYDKHPQATALREVLRHANNLAALMFNNRVGITAETYWQAFVATAKDTLVIKSGFVTGANIASNLVLLWMSGVNPVQSSKDHAEAYTATWKYLQDQEKHFAVSLKLDRPNLTQKERHSLRGEQAFLHQEMMDSPVRDLMEAGMYSAIVDDVEVGEHVMESKDWIDKKLEPLANRTPESVKAVAKTFMLTHDTKAYKVMRDMAQISDFAARYSLHKHNLDKGMKFEESIEDIRTTFVDYDTPSHKSLQYANDMGLMGFTKYFFRIQQVILKRFAENPARMLGFAMTNNLLGLGIASPLDALFGFEGLSHRFYTPDDWVDFSTQTAPMNLLSM